ncbi:NCS1 family nucleobase:cation symporter-1 [Komagataeibacter oboediens]|uniref:NCS1 family nucleobase:cation symporter-1 n=1 Tax=Komagataeibacter oboediens TaxID=65958 RepID=UPI001C2BB83E|nr:NCS1 family nucleobase:cation symporter-1 [Komagataeibacter oboediens]MBV0890030.1 NCS1 family nucleobase:cation symporter-1 [Komagataeibacter oboediens]MCK9820370.1 NCS1 family nucleobase:cation symporter-1 [Komagataeibacter oboediens]
MNMHTRPEAVSRFPVMQLGGEDDRLRNRDLLPAERQDWGWYDYLSFWMSDVHSVGGYVTAGNLFTLGLPSGLVFAALLAGVLIVNVLCNLVAVPSQRTGTPFPVVCRMSFGVLGANIPALIRGVIAVCWYGIQTWLASNALVVLALRLVPGLTPWAEVRLHGMLGLSAVGWGAFALLWLVQAAIFWRGIETIRRFIELAGPAVYAVMIALDLYLLHRVGWRHFSLQISGVGAPLHGGTLVWTGVNAVALVVSYFSGPMLNFGDFARYGRGVSDIRRGNFWGLPFNFVGFSALTICTIALTAPAFGHVMIDPVETVAHIDSLTAVIFGMLTFIIATAGINIVANFVSASFDFSNLSPRHISLRGGGMIAAAGSILIMPWKLYGSPHLMHLTLDVLATFIGPLFGILVCDYYIVRRRQVDVAALYTTSPQGCYWYRNGINPAAVVALLIAVLVGSAGVFIPALSALSGFAWFMGCLTGGGSYLALMKLAR